MNGWKTTAWKASWGNSWGAAISTTVRRVKRSVMMPFRYIKLPMFKKGS